MRYLAIGDIHGYADVLTRLLEAVCLRPDDQVITLGDYVDRGPDSRGVMEYLLVTHSDRSARAYPRQGLAASSRPRSRRS